MRVHILDNGGDELNKILLWLSENEEILDVNVQKEAGAFLDKAKREKPELVFIRLGDAEIPGLEVGRLLKGMDFEPKIVFVASRRNYAIDAYEVGADGYLLCPVERKKFDRLLSDINH